MSISVYLLVCLSALLAESLYFDLVCLKTRPRNGGLIEVNELCSHLEKLRGRNSQPISKYVLLSPCVVWCVDVVCVCVMCVLSLTYSVISHAFSLFLFKCVVNSCLSLNNNNNCDQ